MSASSSNTGVSGAIAANPAALQRVVTLTLLASIFVVVLVRTAWVCDDAYITFRTVDNFVHGHGLR